MMKKNFPYLLAVAVVAIIGFIGCQKELSLENGNTPAQGSLRADGLGDCLPKTVNGTYSVGVPLVPAANTISVAVDVTRTGSYTITTDTVNGIFFSGTGLFTATGINNVTLRGNGTPFANGVFNYIVAFDGTFCDVQVTVASPATFTLAGAPGTCTTANVAGSYAIGTALNSTNTVTLNVNVTVAGSYNVTTTFQGMTFSGTGVLSTGAQTIVLTGSGTPTTTGANVVPVTAGASTCSFTVNVSGPGVCALAGAPGGCTSATINGMYMVGVPLTATNTVVVTVDVTTPGAFNITTNTVNGYSFAFSGNLNTTGVQTVTLTGTGTPGTAQNDIFTVTAGASSCTFTVTVLPPDYYPRTANSNWSYELDDDPLDSVYRNVLVPTHTAIGNTYNIFMQNDGTGPDSSGYYRKNSGDYFEWFDYGTWIGFDNPGWAEYIMLKDNVAANTNWKSAAFSGTVTTTPVTVRFSYTVTQKDVPLSFVTSLGTANFTNVIVVEEKIEGFNTATSTWVDLTATLNYYGKSYFARGVGLIKFEAYNAANAVTFKQELRRYQVF